MSCFIFVVVTQTLPSVFGLSDLRFSLRHFRRIKDTIIRSFVKCDNALPTSGERDNEINIEGIPEYTIGQSYDVEEVMFYDSSDDELDMVVGSDGGDV